MKVQMPSLKSNFIYGTAWKENLTEECVLNALRSGYRVIDTANQRKHYYEEGVGRALAKAYKELGIKREELFLQTKFTYARGQDHRKPYDENSPLKKQVEQSFQSSLEHLQTDSLDSYVLHGPSTSIGLTKSDWETWSAMEDLLTSKKIKHLGISNVNFDQLVELYETARIKPTFVQNRCFAETRWDKDIREFCLSNEIIYQGFSLLTANRDFLGGDMIQVEGRNIPQLVFAEPMVEVSNENLHPQVAEILKQTGKNIEQVIFRFCHQIGILPITGTRSPNHMKANLEISDLNLSKAQLDILETSLF